MPFYTLSLVFLLINVALSQYLNTPSVYEMVYSLLLQQSNSNTLPSGVMWFLFTLFSCAFLTYVAIRLLKMKPLHFLYFSLALKLISSYYIEANFLAFDTTSRYLFFFVLGYAFDKKVIERPIYQWKYLASFFAAYLILIVIYFKIAAFPPWFAVLFDFIRSFEITGILVTLIIFGLAHHVALSFADSWWLKFFLYCGTSSMLIYVFHMPTFTVVNKIAESISLDANSTRLTLLFGAGVLLPLLYGKILSYNKVAYKLLIGRDPR